MRAAPSDADVVRAAAEVAMAYPYRVWGFGEDVGLRGLLAAADHLGEARYRDFVLDLTHRWCSERGPLTNADHVAPGRVLLIAFRQTGDRAFLDTALELADLLDRMPREGDVILHRPDLEPWRRTIWVDCMYMDAPFLVRLAAVVGDDRWLALGTEHALGYLAALRDPESDLLYHGYDAGRRRVTGQPWGRGNGWALLGMVETLEALPEGHPAAARLRAAAAALIRTLLDLQHPSGAWRTVLPDPDAPIEASTAPLFATGLMMARRIGIEIAGDSDGGAVERAIASALHYLRRSLRPDGSLPVSTATPIGDRATYVDREHGVFPWGQGPALLALTEAARFRVASEPEAADEREDTYDADR